MFFKKPKSLLMTVLLVTAVLMLSSCGDKSENLAQVEPAACTPYTEETEPTVWETTEPTVPTETEQITIPTETAPPETTIPPAETEPIIRETENLRRSHSRSSLTKETLTTKGGAFLSYWLYTPENAEKGMPLLLYLHGGRGKGSDLDMLMQQDGFPKYLHDGAFGEVPGYIVIPQMPANFKGWLDVKDSIRELVGYCEKNYGIDPNRVSLTGHSMGGTGAWSLALAYPTLFSRVAPMSGSIRTNEANINALADLPIWAFVGESDTIVEPESSIRFIDQLSRVNESAQITVFEGADHVAVPELAYLDEELDVIGWLLS